TANALSWAQCSGKQPNWWAKRLSIVRGFANYVAGLEPGASSPAPRADSNPVPPSDAVPLLRAGRRSADGLCSSSSVGLVGAHDGDRHWAPSRDGDTRRRAGTP